MPPTPLGRDPTIPYPGKSWNPGTRGWQALVGWQALAGFPTMTALLEHINLNILDEPTAREFYVSCLGAVVNEPTTNERQLHVNMGATQFHLLRKYGKAEGVTPVTAAQRWAGEIELWTSERLDAIADRLTRHKLRGHVRDGASDVLRVRCPYGNAFVIRHEAPGSCDGWGCHPSGSGALTRLVRAVHDVRPGAAARLAHFWKETLGGEACELQPSGTPPLWCEGGVAGGAGSGEDTAGLQQCVVRFGAAPQQLVFAERRSAPPPDEYERNEAAAYHICVYLETAERFAACFRACEAAGLLYANEIARDCPEMSRRLRERRRQGCSTPTRPTRAARPSLATRWRGRRCRRAASSASRSSEALPASQRRPELYPEQAGRRCGCGRRPFTAFTVNRRSSSRWRFARPTTCRARSASGRGSSGSGRVTALSVSPVHSCCTRL